MTKIKLCGLTRDIDIEIANDLKPEYIGFVFAKKSRRCVSPYNAAELKKTLDPHIKAVGVFVDEKLEIAAELLANGVIDIAQLHGGESEEYLKLLKQTSGKPVVKAFRIKTERDVLDAKKSSADFILLDSGAGTGKAFDWKLIKNVDRPYFLAGGLDISNVKQAIRTLNPFAVDVSSGIETDGFKDKTKAAEFVAAVRKENI